jgi:vacuolar iron transporter family protein
MEKNILVGLSFGITSAAITTLGLIVGLEAATSSLKVILGGIFTIAIADAFSDSLGIHISQEAEKSNTTKDVWVATIVTFFAKFLFSMTFVVPFLLLPMGLAMFIGIAWGLFIIASLSFFIAKREKKNPVWSISEHLIITIVVIFLTHQAGLLISQF